MLSRTPATLPCRNCAFNAWCPDKYFIFFLQRGNNVGWERRKKIYKLKKVCGHRVVNTTMLSQVPEFRRILEECTHVEPHLEKRRLLFRWKQHWWIAHRITTLFAYSSATSEGTENELSIYLEAGRAIDQCNGLTLRAQSHPLLSRYHLRLDKGEGCCYGQCLCGIQFIKGNQITQRVNIEKKKKENIDVKSCADARRLRHAS